MLVFACLCLPLLAFVCLHMKMSLLAACCWGGGSGRARDPTRPATPTACCCGCCCLCCCWCCCCSCCLLLGWRVGSRALLLLLVRAPTHPTGQKEDLHTHTHTYIHTFLFCTSRRTESLIESAQPSRSGMVDQSVIVELWPYPTLPTLPCPALPHPQFEKNVMARYPHFLVSFWTEPFLKRLPCHCGRRATHLDRVAKLSASDTLQPRSG